MDAKNLDSKLTVTVETEVAKELSLKFISTTVDEVVSAIVEGTVSVKY